MSKITSETQHATQKEARHEDLLTGEPGSHPLATGIGTAMGGFGAGAIVGSLVGPIGTVAGAVIGGVSGGMLGRTIAESIQPTVEPDLWRETYEKSSYFDQSVPFQTIEPAYRLGADSYASGVSWEDIEPVLATKWDRMPTDSSLPWARARLAAKDAYIRSLQLADTVDCNK